MLTIEMRDGKVLKMWNEYNITEYDSTDLIEELNSYLNNGWKLISIENGVYNLDVDETQLMYVNYFYYDEELEEVMTYNKVISHADAYLIRQYFNCEVTDEDNYIYKLNERNFEMLDLRYFSDELIKYYIEKECSSMFDLLELIKDNMSCI